MANVLPTTSLVAKETLAVLKNLKGFYRTVNRDYDKDFRSDSATYDTGATINIRKPPRFQYRAGRVATPQDVIFPTVPLTVNQGGTEYAFTTVERTLSVSRFEEIVYAAAETVRNQIDLQGLDLARRTVGNTAGTVGTLPNTQALALQTMLAANQRLDEMGGSRIRGDRSLAMSPLMNASLVQGLAGLFNSQSTISKQYDTGMMVDSLNLNVFMDQNVARHTNGTQPISGGTVNGAGQSGSTITVNAASITGTILAGTPITFAGVFAVNPQSRQSTGSLAQFAVAADVAAAATTITLTQPMNVSGSYQNVTNSPANAAVITTTGAANANYDCSVAYDKNAFTLAMVPMAMPFAGGKATQMSDDGITVKVTEFYDGINDNNLMRLDVLFGWAATYPELAVKVIA